MTDSIWVHQARPRTTWYGLDEERRVELRETWAKLDEKAARRGAERIGTYAIRGQSDYSMLEVWRFGAPEAIHEFWAERVQADYAVWFAFSNQLGAAFPQEES